MDVEVKPRGRTAGSLAKTMFQKPAMFCCSCAARPRKALFARSISARASARILSKLRVSRKGARSGGLSPTRLIIVAPSPGLKERFLQLKKRGECGAPCRYVGMIMVVLMMLVMMVLMTFLGMLFAKRGSFEMEMRNAVLRMVVP
jgi:hypothetical protein